MAHADPLGGAYEGDVNNAGTNVVTVRVAGVRRDPGAYFPYSDEKGVHMDFGGDVVLVQKGETTAIATTTLNGLAYKQTEEEKAADDPPREAMAEALRPLGLVYWSRSGHGQPSATNNSLNNFESQLDGPQGVQVDEETRPGDLLRAYIPSKRETRTPYNLRAGYPRTKQGAIIRPVRPKHMGTIARRKMRAFLLDNQGLNRADTGAADGRKAKPNVASMFLDADMVKGALLVRELVRSELLGVVPNRALQGRVDEIRARHAGMSEEDALFQVLVLGLTNVKLSSPEAGIRELRQTRVQAALAMHAPTEGRLADGTSLLHHSAAVQVGPDASRATLRSDDAIAQEAQLTAAARADAALYQWMQQEREWIIGTAVRGARKGRQTEILLRLS